MKNFGSVGWTWLALVTLACGGGGGGGGGGGSAVEVADHITAATTFAPVEGADCDVTVTGVVEARAAVTVEPGTKVCFEAEAGLKVAATGSLHAVGTADKRIQFTGVSPTPGYWKGISFESNNVANALEFADVSFAGNNAPLCCGFFIGSEDIRAAVLVWGGRLSMKNSVISRSANHGLFLNDTAVLDGFTANRFAGNGTAPVGLYLHQASSLDAASVYSGGAEANGKNFVRVLELDPLTTAQTLRKLDVPWGISEGWAGRDITVRTTLTVQAGARLEFEANSGFIIDEAGTLVSNGTPTERVVFTGRSATPGFWKGLAFLSAANTLAYTDVDYAGSNDDFCCGFWEPTSGSPAALAGLVIGDYNTAATVSISNVNVRNSANRGVSKVSGTLEQAGTNDLSTGNARPNLL